jgi:hypothetical protein
MRYENLTAIQKQLIEDMLKEGAQYSEIAKKVKGLTHANITKWLAKGWIEAPSKAIKAELISDTEQPLTPPKDVEKILRDKIVNEIIEELIKGARKTTILKSIKRKFKIDNNLATAFYGIALTELENNLPTNVNAIYAMHIESRLYDAKMLRQVGDYASANRVMQDLARLQGLYPKEQGGLAITEQNKSDTIELIIPDEYKEFL